MLRENIVGIVLFHIIIWSELSLLTSARQDVVLQIVMPYQQSAEKQFQSTHLKLKEKIKHSREVAYGNLRQQFAINSWLNFTQTESPSEILSLFCSQIFQKPVNTILSLNYGSGSASSNSYILQLANHLGYPVISWDPHYPGALQVCILLIFHVGVDSFLANISL